ncbi:MAG: CCA tRNA nucleotidyltransferase [Anaerohalosphaeraceae bacterium]|nr:CCA tRNA nucleotidyltransferase [Anaerohalosphaeraceae bacterium]
MTNKQAAIQIIKTLRREGFQALLAGGCVRDMLLGRRAKDYDVATDARPNEICDLFRRTIKVGAKFGVIIVLTDAQQVEVATFRSESGYSDGRHPEKVEFTSAKEDAIRRDFTINGMFFDPVKKELTDYVGGRKDLERKIIRTIGNAEERLSDDYLRMLRAVRFAAQLDFKIASGTIAAIRKNHKNILEISGERTASELDGLLSCPNRVKGLKILRGCGLSESIFPILENESSAKFGEKVCNLLPNKASFSLALAAIFSDYQTANILDNCKILKLSRNQRKYLTFLLEKRGVLLDKDMSLASLKRLLVEPCFEDLYVLQRAIQKTSGQSTLALTAIRKRANALSGTELKPTPLLDGNQLIALGAKPGPQVGRIARRLYTEQLGEKITTVPQAKKWLRNWLKKNKD